MSNLEKELGNVIDSLSSIKDELNTFNINVAIKALCFERDKIHKAHWMRSDPKVKETVDAINKLPIKDGDKYKLLSELRAVVNPRKYEDD